MTKHVQQTMGLTVHEYPVDTLGAPFDVYLIDSVSMTVDPATGDEMVHIPDVVGLIGAVVRTRVKYPRKLNGREIKFIRDALGVQAKDVAQFLDMSAEHLSRCEAGVKVMSSNSEKSLRLFAFMATFFKEPEDVLFIKDIHKLEPKSEAKLKKATCDFMRMFLSMKIEPAFDNDEPLCFEFVRRPSNVTDMPDDDMEYELANAA